MTHIALAASVPGRTRLLLVLFMLAVLILLAVAGAFAAFPVLQHTSLGHTLAGTLTASEGGPPPGH